MTSVLRGIDPAHQPAARSRVVGERLRVGVGRKLEGCSSSSSQHAAATADRHPAPASRRCTLSRHLRCVQPADPEPLKRLPWQRVARSTNECALVINDVRYWGWVRLGAGMVGFVGVNRLP